jgi:alpha-beta hydrolase superfamily lysophospholipase
MKLAMKGTRSHRAQLIRDPNKLVSAAVLSSPKLTEQEIESFAKIATLPEEILRAIAMNKIWMKNYGVVAGLTRNPKTPLAISLQLLQRLNDRDMRSLSMDRNVPEGVRIAARRWVVKSGH